MRFECINLALYELCVYYAFNCLSVQLRHPFVSKTSASFMSRLVLLTFIYVITEFEINGILKRKIKIIFRFMV